MSRPISLLTTISVILNIAFIAYFVMEYSGKLDGQPASEPTAEKEVVDPIAQIKEIVLERERAKLPLTTQEYSEVHSIKIDSLVLTKTTSPYEGYLVTTWDFDKKVDLSLTEYAANGYKDKYVRRKKTMYVEISFLRATTKGEVDWNTDWLGAYFSLN